MSHTTTEASPPQHALSAFAQAMREAVAELYPGAQSFEVGFEAPRRPEFGDFATNAAFALAKIARRSPNDVAGALIERLRADAPDVASLFASIEPVAGFINVRLAPQVWQTGLRAILEAGSHFGEAPRSGISVSLEFGSANPTGPLVVVQGRALSIGDALVKTMRMRGYDVFTEWIINDAGGQIEELGRSIYARYRQQFEPGYPFPQDGYPGEYLIPLAVELKERDGDRWVADEDAALPVFAQYGRDRILEQQRRTATRFGVQYDLWQSEKEMHLDGRLHAGIDRLRELGLTYEQEGATFFAASKFGDDKDRVVVRADGRPTYLAADVAYHYEKLKRAQRVIDILGPDHHGYIGRLQGLASALGFPGHLQVLIAQQITLLRGGEHVSMSKRAGQIVTLDDILDEVGVDAARFFFVMLATDSPLTFDLALAIDQSNENPVYYVQYGHARIASVLRNADPADVEAARSASLHELTDPVELALIRRLDEFPRVAQGVVDALAPHRLARYARDVATDFHQFYNERKILTEDRAQRLARLALSLATKDVLARTLGLVGVTAPDSM